QNGVGSRPNNIRSSYKTGRYKKNIKARTLMIIRIRVTIALDMKEREPQTKDSGFPSQSRSADASTRHKSPRKLATP
ncbi:unnamed protein product, partial [Arabidopsis halleri]